MLQSSSYTLVLTTLLVVNMMWWLLGLPWGSPSAKQTSRVAKRARPAKQALVERSSFHCSRRADEAINDELISSLSMLVVSRLPSSRSWALSAGNLVPSLRLRMNFSSPSSAVSSCSKLWLSQRPRGLFSCPAPQPVLAPGPEIRAAGRESERKARFFSLIY